MSLTLYDYWRSSAAYRVRIGLNIKGLDYQTRNISLVDGEQRSEDFLAVNAQGLVPVLQDGDIRVSQSLAILEYLDEAYPEIPLLPEGPAERARARQISGMIACDIHPLCNLRVLKYLQQELTASDDQKMQWYHHWVREGLQAVNQLVEGSSGRFCVGDRPTIADICLIPQLYNASRFDVPISDLKALQRVEQECSLIAAFVDAKPVNASI